MENTNILRFQEFLRIFVLDLARAVETMTEGNKPP